MRLIDGKMIAGQIRSEVARDVLDLQGRKPTIALVRVGEDPASRVYVASKAKACEECGIGSRNVHLPEDVTEDHLLGTLRDFNDDNDVIRASCRARRSAFANY